MKKLVTLLNCCFLIISMKAQIPTQPAMNFHKHFCGNSALPGDNQGLSVDTYKNKVIMGAHQHAYIGSTYAPNVGCAFIFEETSPNTWVETKLSPPDGKAYDSFGTSVAINDSFAVVGAPYHSYHFSNSSPSNSILAIGAAYVFKKVGVGNWVFLNKLSGWAGQLNPYDNFGASVCIDDDKTIAVGAPGFQYDAGGVNAISTSGAVFVWQYTTTPFPHFTNQIPTHHITAPHRRTASFFGVSVAIDSDRLVIGSPGYPSTSSTATVNMLGAAGAAYVLTKNTNNQWQHSHFLYNTAGPYRMAGAEFGKSVAIHDSVIVIGCPGQDATPTSTLVYQGMAIAFKQDASGNYNLINFLTSPNALTGAKFGASVSVHNRQIIVGGREGNKVGNPSNSGICALYKENTSGQFQQQNWSTGYAPNNSSSGDWFGSSVSIYKNRFVGGGMGISYTPASSTPSGNIGAGFMFCGAASYSTHPTNKIVCENSSTQFSVSTFFVDTYQWQVSTNNGSTWSNINNSGIYSGANTNKLTLSNIPLNHNGYWYQCLISNECSTSPYVSNTAVLTVDAGPGITFTMNPNLFCTNSSTVTLSAYSIWGGSYSGAGVSGNQFNPATAGVGTHTIGFTSTNGSTGCSYTAVQTVTVSTCAGLPETSTNSAIMLYPNPSNSFVHIENAAGNIRMLKIYNILGCEVMKVQPDAEKVSIDVRNFPGGNYLIEISTHHKTERRKITITR
ncbi:MAG: T9SS type A sorting domain-containing protein [Sediminibacterium sp.]|nr:T9SS type A sorting domain-containing protein [Sediminibacterium sp.]